MKKNNVIKLAVGICIVVVITGSITYALNLPQKYHVYSATIDSVQEEVKGDGEIISNTNITYYADVTAPIKNLPVKEGDCVKKGDLAITYSTSDLETDYQKKVLLQAITVANENGILENNNIINEKLNKATSAYEQACIYEQFFQDNIDQAEDKIYEAQLQEQALKSLKVDVERMQALVTHEIQDPDMDKDDMEVLNDTLLQKTLDLNAKEKEVAKIDIASLNEFIADCTQELTFWKEEKVRQRNKKEADETKLTTSQITATSAIKNDAAFDVEQANKELEKGQNGITIISDGVITELTVKEGETVTDGTKLFTVADNKDVCVRVDISKYEIDKIREKQEAIITIGNHEYQGSVNRIDQKAQNDSAAKPKVYVEVAILNPDENVYLGLEANVTIKTFFEENVICVPSEAIYAEENGDYVYALVDGKINKKEVTTGLSGDGKTEIMKGVEQGEQVIIDACTDDDIGKKGTGYGEE